MLQNRASPWLIGTNVGSWISYPSSSGLVVMRGLTLLLWIICLHLVAPEPAQAYIDPSAGSLVIQVAAGVILGGLLTVRGWWTRVGDTLKLVWHKVRRR
jgi:hypothetical protein